MCRYTEVPVGGVTVGLIKGGSRGEDGVRAHSDARMVMLVSIRYTTQL